MQRRREEVEGGEEERTSPINAVSSCVLFLTTWNYYPCARSLHRDGQETQSQVRPRSDGGPNLEDVGGSRALCMNAGTDTIRRP